jgi:hypothetical protein
MEIDNFNISDLAELIDLHTCDVEFMEEEEPGPLKKHLRKSQQIIEITKTRCMCHQSRFTFVNHNRLLKENKN